ncbi:MAG: hydroxymethylbilane synthase [Hyphomicrobiaceae bacterium]|nr:hydroxymethylbilane synthase [Hyphomicrobiaceae bacterium]
MQATPIRIGTRGSPLALAQAHEVRARLMAAHGLNEQDFEITVIKTAGDRILDRPLAEVGGKGLFTKEIEEALLSREIDLAVHSMKDMQTELPDGLEIGAVLPREDVRDAFISLAYGSLMEMPSGAVVGTSSLRRQAQVRRLRPDLEVVGFRGNVQTRLKKLEDGVAGATFLACAGLNRLGLSDRVTRAVPTSEMLPAVAQAAIGIEVRGGDEKCAGFIAPLRDVAAEVCVRAERAFLKRLEGSCRTPIAGLALFDTTGNSGRLVFEGEILTPDGRVSHATRREGLASDAALLGDDAAQELLGKAGPGFFSTAG